MILLSSRSLYSRVLHRLRPKTLSNVQIVSTAAAVPPPTPINNGVGVEIEIGIILILTSLRLAGVKILVSILPRRGVSKPDRISVLGHRTSHVEVKRSCLSLLILVCFLLKSLYA